MQRLSDLGEISPMLFDVLVSQVLEKDPETFDQDAQLSNEDAEKLLGFLSAMELQRKRAGRKLRRIKVNGQFSKNFKESLRKKNC